MQFENCFTVIWLKIQLMRFRGQNWNYCFQIVFELNAFFIWAGCTIKSRKNVNFIDFELIQLKEPLKKINCTGIIDFLAFEWCTHIQNDRKIDNHLMIMIKLILYAFILNFYRFRDFSRQTTTAYAKWNNQLWRYSIFQSVKPITSTAILFQ